MRGAHPEREVETAIERSVAVARGERVLVACSGGVDSIALAAALHAVAPRLELTLCLGHVNHAVRASAWQDECVVLDLAARLDLPVEIALLAGVDGDEAALRAARYAALAESAWRKGCSAIATAHHAQDQSETVLLALLRGTGPAGLNGIAARRILQPGIEIVRPLLAVPPEALRGYCHAKALPYAVDPTNADASKRRNAVREALETLRPLFPGLDRAVARAAETAGAERSGNRRAALRRLVRERFAGDDELRDIDFAHVEAAVRAIESRRTGTYLMKPGIHLRIERGLMKGIITEQ
ncbi:MAG TPA: tRNA lysidine(34) synthetase TilS [Candidatus Cybelea sp.]|nr:tRNA lysidine(34) synthetase TilS [Candidatus Cybelea sp.]